MRQYADNENQDDRSESADGEALEDRWLTVPNVLCTVRLAGSIGMLALALAQQPQWFLGLFLLLTATDWLDGKLAVWLDQRSSIGPRLDSIADGTMYAAVLLGGLWLKFDVLLDEWVWIAAAVASYITSCVLALIRYRKLPSYHTRTAKTAWLFMVVAVISLFMDWSVWPLRIAMMAVVIANLDAILITCRLPEWRANVRSFLDAERMR